MDSRSELWLPLSVEFTEEEEQDRQNRRDKFYQLAQEIAAAYLEDPTLTIEQIGERIEGAEHQDVVFILNEFTGKAGEAVYVGQGQGGNWIPEEVRVTLVDEVAGDPNVIGYRWPDGSLREEPFDLKNADHLAEMGIQAPVGTE